MKGIKSLLFILVWWFHQLVQNISNLNFLHHLLLYLFSLNFLHEQLSSTTTAYNATINITGHILLGLGIATAVLIYMFKKAWYMDDGYSHHGNGYGYYRKVRVKLLQTLTLHQGAFFLLYFTHKLSIIFKPFYLSFINFVFMKYLW